MPHSAAPSNTSSVRSFDKNDLSLVKKIAHHIILKLPQHVALDDLVQAGCVGLVEAYQNYNADKGASFDTYAAIRIRGAIIDEMRRGDWAPRSVHRKSRIVTEKILEIEQKTGQNPTKSQISQELNMSAQEIDKILHDHNATKVLFFDDLGLDDDFFYHSLFQNALNPMQQAQMSELHLLIKEMLTKIDPKESLVLQLYFHEEKQLRDIAALLHVSESRISQMISSAIKRLKTLLQSFDV